MRFNTGRLGGNISLSDKAKLIAKYITPRLHRAVDLGARCQCRCGGTRWLKWREAWYCVRCGNWVRVFARMPTVNGQSVPSGSKLLTPPGKQKPVLIEPAEQKEKL